MQYGDFYYPMPVNEPVLSYAPGSTEKKRLKEVLAELKKEKIDVPMYIGALGIGVVRRIPERGGRRPETDSARIDKASGQVFRWTASTISEKHIGWRGRGVDPELILFQVADPVRRGHCIGTEKSEVHLIEEGAANAY